MANFIQLGTYHENDLQPQINHGHTVITTRDEFCVYQLRGGSRFRPFYDNFEKCQHSATGELELKFSFV